MSEEKKLPHGKYWCVGMLFSGGKSHGYVPFVEDAVNACLPKFKVRSDCQAECDRRNAELEKEFSK
jgi:hypothetical protein